MALVPDLSGNGTTYPEPHIPTPGTGGGGGGGDASAANQVTGNNILTAINTKLTAYSVVRTITPGTPVTAGKAVAINCTTAGIFTLTLNGGNAMALSIAVGTSFIDQLAVVDVTLSGGAVGTVYVLDTP